MIKKAVTATEKATTLVTVYNIINHFHITVRSYSAKSYFPSLSSRHWEQCCTALGIRIHYNTVLV